MHTIHGHCKLATLCHTFYSALSAGLLQNQHSLLGDSFRVGSSHHAGGCLRPFNNKQTYGQVCNHLVPPLKNSQLGKQQKDHSNATKKKHARVCACTSTHMPIRKHGLTKLLHDCITLNVQ